MPVSIQIAGGMSSTSSILKFSFRADSHLGSETVNVLPWPAVVVKSIKPHSHRM
jgi:hypothetical protein